MASLKRIATILFFLPSICFCLPRFSGYCQQGNTPAKTSNISSSNVLQGSFPRANVTAYITGGAVGVVSTSGTTVTWVSGTQFDANSDWSGLNIIINSVQYVIASVSSPTSMTLISSAGTQTSVAYSITTAPAPIFSDYAGTVPKSNPLTCDSTGYFFFYSLNSTLDEKFSGTGIASPFTLSAVSGIDPLSTTTGLITYNASIGTAAQQCTAAYNANQTLIVAQPMAALSTQSMPCSMQLLHGGIIQPASGQTVTLANCPQAGQFQIFDISAGGTIAVPSACAVNAAWWGNTVAGFNAALAASKSVAMPSGTVTMAASLTGWQSGQTVTCSANAATVIQFTASGAGVVVGANTVGLHIGGADAPCNFQFTNAGATNGIDLTAGGYNYLEIHAQVSTSGSGAVAWGIKGSGVQQSKIYFEDQDQNLNGCVHLDGNSNGTDLYSVHCQAPTAVGVEIDGSQVSLIGGVIEGTVTKYLVHCVDGATCTLSSDVYLENHETVPWIDNDGAFLKIDSAFLGGGSSSNTIYSHGVGGFARISHLNGISSASGCVVLLADTNQTVSQSSISDSLIFNATGGGVGHAVCANAGRLPALHHSAFFSSDDAIVNGGAEQLLVEDSTIQAGTNKYGINETSGNGLIANSNDFLVTDTSHLFTGLVATDVQFNNLFHGGSLVTSQLGAQTFSSVSVSGAVNTVRPFNILTGASMRWRIYGSPNPESGGNAGTYLSIDSYADDGSTSTNVLKWFRDGSGVFLYDQLNLGLSAAQTINIASPGITTASGVGACPMSATICWNVKVNGTNRVIPLY